jgi:hypothetical protein
MYKEEIILCLSQCKDKICYKYATRILKILPEGSVTIEADLRLVQVARYQRLPLQGEQFWSSQHH